MNVLAQKLSIIAASLQFVLETQCGISGLSALKAIYVNTLSVITNCHFTGVKQQLHVYCMNQTHLQMSFIKGIL